MTLSLGPRHKLLRILDSFTHIANDIKSFRLVSSIILSSDLFIREREKDGGKRPFLIVTSAESAEKVFKGLQERNGDRFNLIYGSVDSPAAQAKYKEATRRLVSTKSAKTTATFSSKKTKTKNVSKD